MIFTAVFLIVYSAVFIWQAVYCRCWQWLIAALVLHYGLLIAGVRLFPGLGLRYYYPYFYTLIGSLFFFVNAWKWLPEKRYFYGNPFQVSPLLVLWAVGNALLHLAFFILFLSAKWIAPPATAAFLRLSLLQLYLLQPVWWIVAHATVMLLLYLNRAEKQQQVLYLTPRTLRGGFWAAVLLVFSYAAADMYRFAALWQS